MDNTGEQTKAITAWLAITGSWAEGVGGWRPDVEQCEFSGTLNRSVRDRLQAGALSASPAGPYHRVNGETEPDEPKAHLWSR